MYLFNVPFPFFFSNFLFSLFYADFVSFDLSIFPEAAEEAIGASVPLHEVPNNLRSS